jgi:alginate O-acetyltransferase complex protein AlgI
MQDITLLPILGFVTVAFMAFVLLPASKKSYALLLGSVVGIALYAVLSLACFVLIGLLTYLIGIATTKFKKAITLGVFILLGFMALYAFNFTQTWTLWQTPIGGVFSGQMLIGWCYFLFNALSYLLDIDRKVIQPERSLLALFRYLLFFPILFAGPMHRKKYLDEQFEHAAIDADSIRDGLRLMLWGLFKNLVIAKRLFMLFQFLQASELKGPALLIQGIVFFFYIYASFSSFVDFFQGVAKLFAIQLSDNFHKRVYWSASRHQFWQGWHITLNAWFRDYFFYRLMKYKFWRNKTQLALFITFLLIALWHDASKAFLLWGILNASWILLEKRFKVSEFLLRNATTKAFGRLYHIGISGFIALVFTQDSPRLLLSNLLHHWHFPERFFWIQRFNLPIIVIGFLFMDYINRKAGDRRVEHYMQTLPLYRRRLLYVFLLMVLFIAGSFSSGINNYYFKF